MQFRNPYWRCLGIGLMLLMVAACDPFAATKTPVSSDTANPQQISLTLDGVPITFMKPAGWHVYRETDHVILTENSDPLNTDGSLQGIVVHLWLPDTPAEDTTSAALSHILATPEMAVTAPVIVTPHSFDWSSHDAAYYMLEAQEGYITLVLAVMLADKSRMVAINISAPKHDMERVKTMLPTLFESFTIAGSELDSTALRDLWQNEEESEAG